LSGMALMLVKSYLKKLDTDKNKNYWAVRRTECLFVSWYSA